MAIIAIAAGLIVIASALQRNIPSAPALDGKEIVPNVKDEAVRKAPTPEQRVQGLLNQLPMDHEYRIVSGEAMDALVLQLSDELIRIDGVMMEYGPNADILDPACQTSKFESRDRKFAFTARWGDWNKGTHKEPKNRLKQLGGEKRGSKVRLWARWHFKKGLFSHTSYLDVDRFEVVDW